MPLSVSSWQSSVSHSLASALAAPVWAYDSGGRGREGGSVMIVMVESGRVYDSGGREGG